MAQAEYRRYFDDHLQLSSISPNATEEFGLVSSVSVIFTLVPSFTPVGWLLLLGHGPLW
ncbi:hypothetical protein ACLK1S_25690 [Escherichia coli]